jgi:phenylpyruvate tautomerase PptA (4-oxalocrotonate tautomerase family)
MPFYEIQHSAILSPEQRQSLAERITELHASMFTAPSLFVNVRFTSAQGEEDYFYGGKRRHGTNRIVAFVRSGGNRGSAMFDKLAEEIEGIWDDVVGPKGEGPEKVLQAVAIVPGLTAREEGFAIPIVSSVLNCEG